ncbi:MAG TPA: TetR/AcrR family transcriptional regulator [Candidatus Dorea intestinavium]|nr:TetR/AcrR family transcriptional regulator [Candidatus Dorea intestinavium]
MPKQTFYNLTKEKRQRLMEAIHLEFSRVPYDKVSINKIINTAEISRGSFYQYFEDKRDVLEYLLEEHQEKVLAEIEKCLKENGGDLFAMFLSLMDFAFYQIEEQQQNNAWLLLLSDIRINLKVFTMQNEGAKNCQKNKLMEKMIAGINRENLNIKEPDDLENMLHIMIPFVAVSFTQIISDDRENYLKNRTKFKKQMDLIKEGFVKPKEKTCLERS